MDELIWITRVRFTPSRSLTNPKAGPECCFIISAWISDKSIFDKSFGGGSKSLEGVDFLPHSFQVSSSSSSTTSSRSSVMWTLRFPPSANRTYPPFGEKMRGRTKKMTRKGKGNGALGFGMLCVKALENSIWGVFIGFDF